MLKRPASLIAMAVLGVVVLATTAAAAEPDWDALTGEAVDLLSQYIRIDTSNPPGNELPGARFLERVLSGDGIASTIYQSAKNRGNLLAQLPGEGDGGALVLLHHIDVVPADPTGWTSPPFGGEVREGSVHGRGTLDDKGAGIMQLVALLARHREQRACKRPIVFLAVADEEVGGELGAKFMLAEHGKELRAAAVWNEGGASLEGILGERAVNSVAVTEKNSLWITLTARGEGGHGSAPTEDAAINLLVSTLSRIADWQPPIHLIPPVREMFGRIGGEIFPGGGFLLRNLDRPVIGSIAAGWITRQPITNSLVRNTIALTGLRAGVKHNVIPNHAEADLDVRLLPDQRPEDFLAELEKVIDNRQVSIAVVGEVVHLPAASPEDTPFFAAVERSLARRLPNSVTVPGLLTGGSDCTAFRVAGIPCYGYAPMRLDADSIRLIHGVDERISIDNLRLGIQVTYDVIDALCEE